MNRKLTTNEVPRGYISIVEAAKILGIDPLDLRELIQEYTRSIHTVSTPSRRLWVFEKDIDKPAYRNTKFRPKKGAG
jgi:hypothetical protein